MSNDQPSTVKSLSEIEAEYFNCTKLVEVVDKTQIESMAKSKTSCCWSAGQKIDVGWVILSQPSRQTLDEPLVVYVCREENFPANALQ